MGREAVVKKPRVGFALSVAGGALIIACAIFILLVAVFMIPTTLHTVFPSITLKPVLKLPSAAYINSKAVIEGKSNIIIVIDRGLEELKVRDCKNAYIILEEEVDKISLINCRNLLVQAKKGYGSEERINCKNVLFTFGEQAPAMFGITFSRAFGFMRMVIAAIACFGIVSGVLVILGGIFAYLMNKVILGGVLSLVFSILSIVSGGGFLVGLTLGVVGGALTLARI